MASNATRSSSSVPGNGRSRRRTVSPVDVLAMRVKWTGTLHLFPLNRGGDCPLPVTSRCGRIHRLDYRYRGHECTPTLDVAEKQCRSCWRFPGTLPSTKQEFDAAVALIESRHRAWETWLREYDERASTPRRSAHQDLIDGIEATTRRVEALTAELEGRQWVRDQRAMLNRRWRERVYGPEEVAEPALATVIPLHR